MTRNRNDVASAIAIVLGALLLIGTMVLHPTDGARALVEGDERHVRFGAWIHGLAIVALYLGVIGLFGVADRLGRDAFLTRAGLAAWITAAGCGLVAAAVSALTAPYLMEAFANAGEARAEELARSFSMLHTVPLALTTVLYGFTFAGIGLWTLRMALERRGPMPLRALGALVTIAGAVGWAGDVLKPDVHSLILFALGVGTWQLGLAAWLVLGGDSEPDSV